MFNKLYEIIKKYIKENYKFLIVLVLLLLILTYPVNYYIYSGGGTINVSDRIKINDKENKQNFYMCYVEQLRPNVMTLLLSYIIPSIDREKINDKEYDKKIDDIINNLLLEESKSNAVINAVTKAGKKISINSEDLYVSTVFDEADTTLEVGDKIKLVNDSNIKTFDNFKDYINNLNYDDEIIIEVEDYNGKMKERKAKIVNINNEKKIGVGITVNYKYKIEDDVKIKFKGNESGPSGGFMLSLSIYDKLTSSNLGGDKKVCGTGTISSDGIVGEIGGVKYKIKGAVKDDCDMFLVPSGDNYKEAIKEKEKNKYDIDVIEIETFDDGVNYLKSLE